MSKYKGKDRRSQTNLDVENSNKNIPERNMKDINNNSDVTNHALCACSEILDCCKEKVQ